MNIFSTLGVYPGKWQVKSTRDFTNDEISAVSSALVLDSRYGQSVCFTMVSGGKTYIPLDANSSRATGDEVDLTKAKLITLSKAGEADIYRVNC